MIRKIFAVASCLVLFTSTALAATKYSIAGKVSDVTATDSVLLITKTGLQRTTFKGKNFSFKGLSAAQLKDAKLYFFKNGAPVGPAALKTSGSFKFLNFSGKAPSGVTTFSATFVPKTGYLQPAKVIAPAWISSTKVANSRFTGASLGYPGATGVSSKSVFVKPLLNAGVATDTDGDGVPDILDIDDNNNGIPDDRDTGSGGSMISTMYLNFASTINAHLGNLNDTSIANLFSSSGVFGLTFFLQTQNDFPTATGGHVICSGSQLLCRSSADGGTTSYYTGVSESNPAVKNQVWSDYNADGSGHPNLEPITFGGGSGSPVLVAAIQPRTSLFSAGEVLTANITRGSTILGTRVFSILPPNISGPMLYSYNTGSGDTVVNYSDASAPGSSGANPITLTGNSLTLNFYPPQRKAIPGVEADGDYRDLGNSKIGVIIGGQNIPFEFTCAGYYSNLSSGISEIPASVSMPGGSTTNQQNGSIVLWPLIDSAPDIRTGTGSLKSLTIDLAHCLSRASLSPGTYMATLTYAGTSTNFGAPRTGQNIHVTIPAASN